MHHVLSLLMCPIWSCHNLRDPSAPHNVHDIALASDEVHSSVSQGGTRELSDADDVAFTRTPACSHRCQTPSSGLELFGCKHCGLRKHLECLRRIALVHFRSIFDRQPVSLDLPVQFGRVLGGPTSVQRNEPSPRLHAIGSSGQKNHQILMLSSTEIAGSEHLACGCETLTWERPD